MSGDILKEKILEIYNDYVEDAKILWKELKYKCWYFKRNYKKIIAKVKEDLRSPKTRKKYLAGLAIVVLFNLLLVNLFVSFGYYNDTVTIPIVHAKVGNLYSNEYDYVLLVYLENTDEMGKGNGTYHLSSDIPYLGYSYSGYKCDHNSTLVYDDNTKVTSVTLNRKDVCSIYFDSISNFDISIKVMLEKEYNSNNYVLSERIPPFGYKYSYYECTNNSKLEYDSNLHKVKLSSSGKEYCSIYFNKEISDITVKLYVENTLNLEDYVERSTIPSNVSYSLNTSKSFCKNMNNERIDNNVSYTDGYINILSTEVSECSVYLDRNE